MTRSAAPVAIVLLAALVFPAAPAAQTPGERAEAAQAADLETFRAIFVSLAQQALASPRLASPMPCLPHWLAGNDHVVVATSAAGRGAGLQAGDRLHRIGDVVLTGRADGVWDAAMRALKPDGAWYTVAVTRGAAAVPLVLPCAAALAAQLTRAERAMWTAVSQRDWKACVGAGEDMIRAFGAEFSPPLMIMGRCAAATTGAADAALTSRLGYALLEELVAHPAPPPDLREQLYLTLRDLEDSPEGARDYAPALRAKMREEGIEVPP